MTYEQAMESISALQGRGWRLGLDRMEEFARRIGLADSLGGIGGPQYIHVAGTNGKGSTTAFLQSLMVETGTRTGAFFSPYVVDPRERVQLGRELISEADLADITTKLWPFAESLVDTPLGGITEFEFKTALGFQYWKEKQCDWVALEVGLGGRLDATNIVTPRASIIVSIGLDHVAILGDTEAQIAHEKAGIIKPGIPVIVGDLSPEAREVIEREASNLEAPIWRWGKEVIWRDSDCSVETPLSFHSGLQPSLIGKIQHHNLSLALAAMVAAGIEVSEEAARLGAKAASIPGRFQVVELQGKTVVLDGAHNIDSARVLRRALQARYGDRKIQLVTHMLSGHEPGEFYREFSGLIRRTHIVPVDFFRATPVDELAHLIQPILGEVSLYESPRDGLEAALKGAEQDDLVVVTGTFYLVGELLREFSSQPNTGSR